MTFVLVDNRRFFTSSFMEEAAFSSYTSSLQKMMAKLFINSKEHQWLQMSGLGAAASPRTVKMVGERYLDLPTIMYALESAHQCTGSVANVCGDSWGSYLVDGIHKVISMIRSSGVQHGRVIMYSTSHHLFGGDTDPFATMNPACQVLFDFFLKSMYYLQHYNADETMICFLLFSYLYYPCPCRYTCPLFLLYIR